MAEARNIFFLDGRGDANLLRLTEVEPGDEVHVDNHAFLAFCYYYRHQITDDAICDFLRVDGRPIYPTHDVPLASPRSEEHTSALQSLMRHSFAVFCLKKKIRT